VRKEEQAAEDADVLPLGSGFKPHSSKEAMPSVVKQSNHQPVGKYCQAPSLLILLNLSTSTIVATSPLLCYIKEAYISYYYIEVHGYI